MRRRRRRAGLLTLPCAAAAAGAVAACEFEAGTAPPVQARVVVHSVLQVGVAEQVVLVERTLTAGRHCSITLPCAPDLLEPILSAGGEPISGAEVVVYGPVGDSAVAVEDASWRPDGKGAGVYRFINSVVDESRWLGAEASLTLYPGQRYALRVTTPLGTARGATTIPDVSSVVPLDVAPVAFNVDRGGGLVVQAEEASGELGYLVQADAALGRVRRLYENPPRLAVFGGSLFVNDVTDPTGESRLTVGLQPGLLYSTFVGAIDENYRRALGGVDSEDPFSAENPGSSIEGGVGVFGSYVPVAGVRLDVVSDVNEAVEGRWTIVEGPTAAPNDMRLYAFRGALSGSFQPADSVAAVIGTRDADGTVRLTFYADRFQSRQLGSFVGTVNSLGQLRGTYAEVAGSALGTAAYKKTVP